VVMLRQVNFDLPPDEVLAPGHQGCAGCGAALAMRVALKALGRKTMLVVPPCCWSVIDGPWPYSAAGVPLMHTPAAAASAIAAGLRTALDLKGDHETTVCALAAGNGSTPALLGALAVAAERQDHVLYACFDIEAHVNTGGWRTAGRLATASPASAPPLEAEPDKEALISSVAALGLPYAATATVAFPDDLAAKFAKARRTRGTTFLHVLAPCPPAWQIRSAHAIRIARLAVMARVFPLVETEHGSPCRLTLDPGHVPLENYLNEQGRFRSLLEQPARVEAARLAIERRWQSIDTNPTPGR
jgi:pyruvate/2-oxoacid:ferredoxin oxidoreductase beta subunit